MGTVIQLKTYDKNHPSLALSFKNLGNIYQATGDNNKALEFYHKALSIQLKVLGINHPDIASIYNNLAISYQAIEKNEKALTFLLKGISMREQALTPDHPLLANSYQNLAIIYSEIGDFEKALTTIFKTINIYEQIFEPSHPSIATAYNNLAVIYLNLENFNKALSAQQKTLKIQKQIFEPNHPNLASSYNNLAVIYHESGNYEKAFQTQEKAISIFKQIYPSKHPYLEKSIERLNLIYQTAKEHGIIFKSEYDLTSNVTIDSINIHVPIDTIPGIDTNNVKKLIAEKVKKEETITIQEITIIKAQIEAIILQASFLDNQKALTQLNRGLELDSLNFQVHKEISIILIEERQLQDVDIAFLFKIAKTKMDTIESYVVAGNLFRESQEKNIARTNYEEALNYYRETKDTFKIIEVLEQLAPVEADLELFNYSMDHYSEHLLLIAQGKSFSSDPTFLLYSLGDVYTKLGEFKQAIDHYANSLKYQEIFKEEYNNKYWEKRADIFQRIGSTYSEMDSLINASDWLHKALDKYEASYQVRKASKDLLEKIARTKFELGKLNIRLKDHPQADKYFSAALLHYEVLGKIKNQVFDYQIAKILLAQSELQLAKAKNNISSTLYRAQSKDLNHAIQTFEKHFEQTEQLEVFENLKRAKKLRNRLTQQFKG